MGDNLPMQNTESQKDPRGQNAESQKDPRGQNSESQKDLHGQNSESQKDPRGQNVMSQKDPQGQNSESQRDSASQKIVPTPRLQLDLNQSCPTVYFYGNSIMDSAFPFARHLLLSRNANCFNFCDRSRILQNLELFQPPVQKHE